MNQNLVEYNNTTATVILPHYKYVDKVLKSTSYEELRERFMHSQSPTKEISESYAAFSNLKKVCKVGDYSWLHIEDGGHTRTAAIFAFFSKSLNFSIDPILNIDKYEKWKELFNTRGIIPIKQKFEDFSEEDLNASLLVQLFASEELYNVRYSNTYNICCVHAHVKLEEVDKQYPNWTYLYSNPCCNPGTQLFTKKYMKDNHIVCIVDKLDMGILSEKRHVVIYKKLHTIEIEEENSNPISLESNKVIEIAEKIKEAIKEI